jgi:hypothetical protein
MLVMYCGELGRLAEASIFALGRLEKRDTFNVCRFPSPRLAINPRKSQASRWTHVKCCVHHHFTLPHTAKAILLGCSCVYPESRVLGLSIPFLRLRAVLWPKRTEKLQGVELPNLEIVAKIVEAVVQYDPLVPRCTKNWASS